MRLGMMRMRMCVLLAGVLVAWAGVGSVSGCNRQIDDSDVEVIGLAEMQRLQADAEGGGRTRIVDVRQPGAFEQAHIPGAINLPLQHLAADHPVLEGARRIVVYSASGTDLLSRAAAKKAMRAGYRRQTVEFQGGLRAWAEAGLPLAGAEAERIEAEVEAQDVDADEDGDEPE